MITFRYAQEKPGQKLHLVPVFGDSLPLTALCGKHAAHWRMDINVPTGRACQNCLRIERQNGLRRALMILRNVLDWYEAQLESEGE